ncbi:transposase [Actinomyces respiraculi]|uniref:transposase n=1 Tax=Actinomyces respiraculi TaxID=2744574 RepID=UPI0039A5257F
MLHTGEDLLTGKQRARLEELFAHDEHTAVEVTWWIYQRMVAAYRHRDRAQGKTLMHKLITSISHGVPPELSEVTVLGRTLHTRATDVLACFDHPRTSNGPTQAVNGRLEHLRPAALGFRNLTNHTTRALLEAGGFRPLLHPGS